jgi:hypothetical protein
VLSCPRRLGSVGVTTPSQRLCSARPIDWRAERPRRGAVPRVRRGLLADAAAHGLPDGRRPWAGCGSGPDVGGQDVPGVEPDPRRADDRGVRGAGDGDDRNVVVAAALVGELAAAVLPDGAVGDRAAELAEADELRRSLLTIPARQRAALVSRFYNNLTRGRWGPGDLVVAGGRGCRGPGAAPVSMQDVGCSSGRAAGRRTCGPSVVPVTGAQLPALREAVSGLRPRCELSAGRSGRVVQACDLRVRVRSGHCSATRLLYFAAVQPGAEISSGGQDDLGMTACLPACRDS